jgi:small subunit ribosomal protein S1
MYQAINQEIRPPLPMREAKRDEKTNGNKNGNGRLDDKPWFELLDQYDYPFPKQGEILRGEILDIQDDALIVDVGSKRDAIVPQNELNVLDAELRAALSPGDTVFVYVMSTPVGNQELLVSLEKGLQQLDWERAEALLASEETVTLPIVGHNKGGLVAQFGRLQGFVPNSHEPDLRRIQDRQQLQRVQQKKIGSELSLKVIELDRERERLILSAIAAEKERRQQQLAELQEGQTVRGKIVNLTDYGAFVDLGFVSGLLHVSKISWEVVEHPRDVLKVGDEVEVRIDKIDRERERLSLNRQALLANPWQAFAQTHEAGQLIEGVVTAVTDFGAFVHVADNIEGLIHISEIGDQYLEQAESVVRPGDTVLTRIVSLEPERERLSLSMRRVSNQEQMDWMLTQQQPPQSPAKESKESEEQVIGG